MRLSDNIQQTVYLLFGLLLIAVRRSQALTGLCRDAEGHAVCLACTASPPPHLYPSASSAAGPRDCCGDPLVFAACQRCFLNPLECLPPKHPHTDLNSLADKPTSYLPVRARRDLDDVGLARRAKYFLGKRGSGSVDNSRYFLGRRAEEGWREDGAEIDDPQSLLDDLLALQDKRVQPFLGKRRVKPFLGKRVSYMLNGYDSDENVNGAPAIEGSNEWAAYLAESLRDKKQRPFLGKREGMTSGESPEVIGDADHDEEKRQRPFLGKRGGGEEWGGGEEESWYPAVVADGEGEGDKRGGASPFLGKRRVEYFLGKRTDSNIDSLEALKSFYMRPLARRAKYFLGKRSQVENGIASSKRQKYFLGKRDVSEVERQSAALSLARGDGEGDEGVVGATHDDTPATRGRLLQAEVAAPAEKRQKYFLGKRDVSLVMRNQSTNQNVAARSDSNGVDEAAQ